MWYYGSRHFGKNISSHYLSELNINIHKKQIRRHIWMLWDKGIENAPLFVNQCYQSWVIKNPDHFVEILNIKEAETLINRNDIINNTIWSTMSIQAKSDVIRAFLLWKFGGIWVDASVLCLKPLSDWMNYTQPFVTFIRHDEGTICKKCKNGKLIGNKWKCCTNLNFHIMPNLTLLQIHGLHLGSWLLVIRDNLIFLKKLLKG